MIAWQDALFTPRRIAVVGASATPGKAGSLFIRNLTSAEAAFQGEVVAIHPSANGDPWVLRLSEPRRRARARSISAIVVTPPAAVPASLRIAARREFPSPSSSPGGFAETRACRRPTCSASWLRTALASGVRILGPNCFGVINTATGLNGSLSIGLPTRGGVSLITQSGAYGMAAYSRSTDDGVGFAKIVALGNKTGIDEVELLEFLGQDPETRVIAMLLESISDGRRLFETAAAVAAEQARGGC